MTKDMFGQKLLDKIKKDVEKKVKELKETPTLAMVRVGVDPASKIYMKKERKLCEDLGVELKNFELENTVSKEEIIALIQKLNKNDSIDGILLQLPLPGHIDPIPIVSKIKPEKDVDGLNPFNLGKLISKEPFVIPCTAKAVISILNENGINVHGKNIVIVNDSILVGRPLLHLLSNNKATVTLCKRNTENLKQHTTRADILIVGVGIKNFITKDMVKKDSVIIDVGINKTENGIKGDVDFENVKDKARFITPVPGGVGPVTVAMVLENLIKLTKNHSM